MPDGEERGTALPGGRPLFARPVRMSPVPAPAPCGLLRVLPATAAGWRGDVVAMVAIVALQAVKILSG